MSDLFSKFRSGLDDPADSAIAVTPSDGADIEFVSRALYVGGGGDVRVQMANDTGANAGIVTFSGVGSGALLPVRVARVYATGTTATNIVAVW